MAKVQLIVTHPIATCIWLQANQMPGDAVWVEPDAARHLIENGLCRWPSGPAVLPSDGAKPMRRPDGWPIDRFSVVDAVWRGKTVVCIGGGPSVTQEAVNRTKDVRVIAINNSYLLAPWADILYFADSRWWEWHREKPEFKAFDGQKVTIENTGLMVADDQIFMLHNGGTQGLSDKPNCIHTGSNSGFQAVNIAVLAGAKRVLLLGYDMHYPGGKSHWHGGHPVKFPEDVYAKYARNFASMLPQLKQLGVEVINCTPGSRIDAFPRGDIASLLPDS